MSRTPRGSPLWPKLLAATLAAGAGWAAHGVRGDFVDYRYERDVAGRPNWTLAVFDTGAFPHFESLDRFAASYDGFIATL